MDKTSNHLQTLGNLVLLRFVSIVRICQVLNPGGGVRGFKSFKKRFFKKGGLADRLEKMLTGKEVLTGSPWGSGGGGVRPAGWQLDPGRYPRRNPYPRAHVQFFSHNLEVKTKKNAPKCHLLAIIEHFFPVQPSSAGLDHFTGGNTEIPKTN